MQQAKTNQELNTPRYDLFVLYQKILNRSDISFDELRYIFSSPKRHKKMQDLMEPDLFSALRNMYYELKKTAKNRVIYEKQHSIFDIEELAKKTRLTAEEIKWVFHKESRKSRLKSLNKNLFYKTKIHFWYPDMKNLISRQPEKRREDY